MNPFEVLALAQCRHCRALVATVAGTAWNPSLSEIRSLRGLLARWERASEFRLTHWFSTFGGIDAPHRCPERKHERALRRRREREAPSPALGVASRKHRARAPWPQPHEPEPGPGPEPTPSPRPKLRAALAAWVGRHDLGAEGIEALIILPDRCRAVSIAFRYRPTFGPGGWASGLMLPDMEGHPPEIVRELIGARLDHALAELRERAGRGDNREA